MALMLRETANESSPMQDSLLGSRQGAGSMQMSNALVPYDAEANSPQKAAIQYMQAQEMNEDKMNPQELGQVIVNLQDEIKIIKLQLENLPGYDIGEVPSHLLKLKVELEKTFNSLEQKNELLVNSMSKNFGMTQQDLPNFRLPEVVGVKGAVGKPSMMGMQTDVLGLDSLYGAAIDKQHLDVEKGAGILKKTLTAAVGSYQPKRTARVVKGPFKPKRLHDDLAYMNDPPPISEDDINQGMISLLNKGIVPKDVDLTPAFEKGAPPVTCRGIKFYDKREKNVRREVLTGGTVANTIKFDLQPVQTRVLVPIKEEVGRKSPQRETLHMASKQLALPPSHSTKKALALPPVGGQTQFDPNRSAISTVINESPGKVSSGAIPNAREYNELMDAYSLHQLIIRKGVLLADTPEFVSFRRTYLNKWGSISFILHLIEKLLLDNEVDMAYVEGKKVAALATNEMDLKKPTKEELYECIVNKEDVSKKIKIPSMMFKGHEGPIIAATVIQKNWRTHKARVAYTYLKFLMSKATVIQRSFRLYLFQKQTKERVDELTNESLFVWKEMMEEFRQKWPAIKKRKRVEIHVNSLSIEELKRISMDKFLQRENAQISRIFASKDPNIDVIYVSPFQMTPDVLGYYMKILEIGDMDGAPNRVNFVVPENIEKFPNHFSLTQILLYSPKTLQRIKSMIKGKQAYIVPGNISTDDIKLSIRLAIPILSGEPQKQHLYSSKSGAKKVFQLADVPTAISSVDIYDEQEFLLSLAKLIANNLYVHTWLFKIDDEFNGRGHAYINIDQVKPLANLRKKPIQVGDSLIEQIIEILSKCLSRKVVIPMKALYHNWAEYIHAFCRVGGVIEAVPTCLSNQMASPSVSFIVEPDGEVQLLGSVDRFASKEYINSGCFYPQQSLPNMNMQTICNSIGEVLYDKGVIGHVTLDLVSFPDPTSPNSHPLFWAVDLNCNMTDYAAACYFFDFLMEGELDPFTGKYTINNSPDIQESRSHLSSRLGQTEDSPYKGHNDSQYSGKKGARSNHSIASSTASSFAGRGRDYSENRCFMYVKHLNHTGISKIQYKTFFHMCRLRSVSFDLERRNGTTFMLQDCLQSGLIALMTIGEERTETLRMMCDAFKFIEELAGNTSLLQQAQIGKQIDDSRSDEMDAADVIGSIRLIYKTYLKKQERERQARTNRIAKAL